ncbi:MAG: leucine-rich repeat domain-containing protein [Bacteroidaceae bacterium]|nr:leucine-rich repeat domain-containing protein [Bacteroidaceae bacterium]
MKKNYLVRALAAVAVLLSPVCANAYDAEINGIYYNFLNRSKVAKVVNKEWTSGSSWTSNYSKSYTGAIEIPATVDYDGDTYTVTGIEEYAFSNCAVTSITLPETVTSIGKYAFNRCSSLSSLTLPAAVTSIGEYAFYNCSSLTSMVIPEGVTSIPDRTFSSCSALASVTLPEGLTSIGNDVFYGCSSLASLTIPSMVTSIGSSAFYGCSSITFLVIPEGVTAIYACTFQDCSKLESVILPETATTIGDKAFQNCEALKTINLPSKVTKIGVSAFSGCTSLTSVVIPEGMTSIDSGTFSGCSSLKEVTFPVGLTSISDYAFQKCTSLKELAFPETANHIGYYAFEGCTKLTTITFLSKSVINMNSQAFANCTHLEDVYSYQESLVDDMGIRYAYKNAFDGSITGYTWLHVPESAIELYKADKLGSSSIDNPWKNFDEIVTLEEQPTSVELKDGETFTNVLEREVETLSYTRSFDNTDWQALYLPFSLSYEDWAADFDVARINNMNQYDDDDNGTPDRTVMEVFLVKEGKLQPHTPYLIRAKQTGEKTFTLKNARLYGPAKRSYTVSSWSTLFTFVGTYTGITGEEMVNGGYYALGDGTLHPAASPESTLSSDRWYMKVSGWQANKQGSSEVKIKVFDENDETGIEALKEETEMRIYDMQGRRVEKPSKGMYIVNGKKVLVK